MQKTWLIATAILALGGGVVVSGMLKERAPDIANGKRLYAENCASCHGANLEGAPNWQTPDENGIFPPPPHDQTGHTWHHDDRFLLDYIRLGGKEMLRRQGIDYDSQMPGFETLLSEADIADILAYIKSTWPDRIRQAQESRNR